MGTEISVISLTTFSYSIKKAVTSPIFLKKIGSGIHSDPKILSERGDVSYINAREKGFQKALLAQVLLRKTSRMVFQLVPSQKYPCL
jgi:hypothetical protein